MSVCRFIAPFALIVWVVPASVNAHERPRYNTCLSLDQYGRPIPNPNAAFVCNQIEFQRQDCENLRREMSPVRVPVMNYMHCFGFTPWDVRAGPSGPPDDGADQKVGGSNGASP